MTELVSSTPVASLDQESKEVVDHTSLGVELAAARERLPSSPTRAEVAKQLNLSVHTIECLEADQFDELPPRLFVRGYIRAYTALLGLPVDQSLRRFDALYPPKVETKPAPSVQTPSARMRKAAYKAMHRSPSYRRRSSSKWGRRSAVVLLCLAAGVLVFRWVKNGATAVKSPAGVVSLQQVPHQALGSTSLVLTPQAGQPKETHS